MFTADEDHQAIRVPSDHEVSDEGLPIPTPAGSKLRVIANLSPCLFRGMSMSLQLLLSPSSSGFLVHAQGPGAQS